MEVALLHKKFCCFKIKFLGLVFLRWFGFDVVVLVGGFF